MKNFDCNNCWHKNVCSYKEQIPKYDDRESDSMFEFTLSCKEYKEEKPVPRYFAFVPGPQVWATGISSKENKDENHIGST